VQFKLILNNKIIRVDNEVVVRM